MAVATQGAELFFLSVIKPLNCWPIDLKDDKFYLLEVFCRRNIDPPLSHSILTSDNTPSNEIGLSPFSLLT